MTGSEFAMTQAWSPWTWTALVTIGFGCSCPGPRVDVASDALDGEEVRTEDGRGDAEVDEADAESAAPPPLDPVLQDFGPGSCGDWEPVARSAPTTVPDGVDGLSEKWRYLPNDDPGFWGSDQAGTVRCCALAGIFAETPAGDICGVMSYEGLFCLGADGRAHWSERIARTDAFAGEQVVGGPLITPDGLVVGLTQMGALVAMRPTAGGAEVGWMSAVTGTTGDPFHPSWRHELIVLAGGYIAVESIQPEDGMFLFDRCGRRRWTIRGVPRARLQAGIGNEALGTAEDRGERVAFAVTTDGRFESPIEIPFRRPSTSHLRLYALGGDAFGGIEYPPYLSTDEPFLWWTARRNGGPAISVALEDSVRPEPYEEIVFAFGQSGDPLMIEPSLPHGVGARLDAYASDGSRKWSLNFGVSSRSDRISYALVGRDGRTVFLEHRWEESRGDFTVVHVLASDGTEEHTLDLPDVVFDPSPSTSPLLTPDGVLFFAGTISESGPRTSWAVLVAVQTPVPGPLPQDPGSPFAVGRDTMRDNWSW